MTGMMGTVRIVLLASVYGGTMGTVPTQAQSGLTVTREPDLVIGEQSGVYFGASLRVAVDSRGMIYVGDAQDLTVRVFTPDGVLHETIGRGGGGPAEFRAVHQIVAGRGDSLYVLDLNLSRVSVFAPSRRHVLAYTVAITADPGQGRPYRLLVPSGPTEDFLVALRRRQVLERQHTTAVGVHRMNAKGEVGLRPFLEERGFESAARVSSGGGGTSVTRGSPLFARNAMRGLTPDDELYYGWSEEIDLAFYDLSGKWIRMFRAESPVIPVMARDIHEMRDASALTREVREGLEPPKTKPAVHTVIVDDQGRIWTGRYTTDPTRHEWWVTLNKGAGESGIFVLPSSVALRVVRGGFAYAVSEDDAGAPRVVGYTIKLDKRKEK